MQRLGLTAAGFAVLALIGFYASRLFLPLPIFAGDEGAYLIRALYPDWRVAANPGVAQVINGVHLSAIRAVYDIGAPVVVGDRLLNAAAYLAGLALIWRWSTAQLPRAQQLALGLLALAFPYYRFAFSDLAEGLFVGVLALLCVVTGTWYRRRPWISAVAIGALGAGLVLVKPNGVASVGALALLMTGDAALSGEWRRLAGRLGLFAAAFFAAGNLIQWAAEEPMNHPLLFFVGDFYGPALAAAGPAHPLEVGAVALGMMIAACAVLAGAPITVGLADLASRWRGNRGRFALEDRDLVLLLLVLSLAATLVMITMFAVKISVDPHSAKLLFGRYFEFFVPLIWLSAGPALTQPIARRTAWTCGAVMAAGVAGLLAGFHAGVVLFPWDSSALTAFFHGHPIRAPFALGPPYRLLACVTTLAAAAALAFKARPVPVGLALMLVFAGLSTRLDQLWFGPLTHRLETLDSDLHEVAARLPPDVERIVALAPDINSGHLVFLKLRGRPRVLLGPPELTPAIALRGEQAVVVSGPETPPGDGWTLVFKGETVSLWQPTPS